MFRRSKKRTVPHDGENPFLLTFSDFMASLLAIFILVLIVTLLQLKKQKDELAKQQAAMNIARSELISGLKDIQSQQINVAKALDGVKGREAALKNMLLDIQGTLKKQGIQIILVENGFHIPENQLQFALGRHEIPIAHQKVATVLGSVPRIDAFSKI